MRFHEDGAAIGAEFPALKGTSYSDPADYGNALSGFAIRAYAEEDVVAEGFDSASIAILAGNDKNADGTDSSWDEVQKVEFTATAAGETLFKAGDCIFGYTPDANDDRKYYRVKLVTGTGTSTTGISGKVSVWNELP